MAKPKGMPPELLGEPSDGTDEGAGVDEAGVGPVAALVGVGAEGIALGLGDMF